MSSQKNAHVFSSAVSLRSRLSVFTNLTSTPNAANVNLNSENVFPNRCGEVTILLPAYAIVRKVLDMAAIPDATAITSRHRTLLLSCAPDSRQKGSLYACKYVKRFLLYTERQQRYFPNRDTERSITINQHGYSLRVRLFY